MKLHNVLLASYLVVGGCREVGGKGALATLAEAGASAAASADAPDVATSGPTGLVGCDSWEVHFAPQWSSDKDGCEGAIVKFLGEAQKYIVMQAYGFTSKPIIDELAGLGDKGIDVSLVLDRSDDKQTEQSVITNLLNHRVRVYFDKKHAIAHNKVVVVDGVSVETGSFNFTRNAQDHNAENCIFVRRCQSVSSAYLQNYMIHQSHSVPADK